MGRVAGLPPGAGVHAGAKRSLACSKTSPGVMGNHSIVTLLPVTRMNNVGAPTGDETTKTPGQNPSSSEKVPPLIALARKGVAKLVDLQKMAVG